MAKLKAHGTELARMESFREFSAAEDESVLWRRTSDVLMSDGVILRKIDVKFRPMSWETKEKHHSYGWKRKAKIKKGITVDQWIAAREKIGFTCVHKNGK